MTMKNEFERYGIQPNDRPSGNLELQLRCMIRVFRLIRAELKSNAGLPWKKRMRAWKSGFSSNSWVICNLDENNPRFYLSDLQMALKGYKINGFFTPIIGNKLMLSGLLHSQHIPHPDIVSTIDHGQMFAEDRPFEPDLERTLSASLERYPSQVFRPSWSGGGNGVFILNRVQEGLKLNGREIKLEEVCALLSRLDRYLATEFQQQARYARTIYPGATNTIRVMSLWDMEHGQPFVAAMSHRFGSFRSGATDNFHGGHGGLCATVNLESSTLGKAARLSADNHLVWMSSHPDTGERIEDVAIPGLGKCIEGVLKAASHFPFCPFIGWDVVITEDGYSILEANTLPALAVVQVHTPLLKDPRSRQFFQYQGMVT